MLCCVLPVPIRCCHDAFFFVQCLLAYCSPVFTHHSSVASSLATSRVLPPSPPCPVCSSRQAAFTDKLSLPSRIRHVLRVEKDRGFPGDNATLASGTTLSVSDGDSVSVAQADVARYLSSPVEPTGGVTGSSSRRAVNRSHSLALSDTSTGGGSDVGMATTPLVAAADDGVAEWDARATRKARRAVSVGHRMAGDGTPGSGSGSPGLPAPPPPPALRYGMQPHPGNLAIKHYPVRWWSRGRGHGKAQCVGVLGFRFGVGARVVWCDVAWCVVL